MNGAAGFGRFAIESVVGTLLVGLLAWVFRRGSRVKNVNVEVEGTQVYVLPKSYIYSSILTGLCACGFAAGGVYMCLLGDKNIFLGLIPSALGFLSFGYFTVYIICLKDYRILVSDEGIAEARHGKSAFLAWNQIGALKGNRYLKRLVAEGKSGVKLKVEYQVLGFDRLLATILDKSHADVDDLIYPKVFGRSNFRLRFWITTGFMGLVGLAILLSTMKNGFLLGCLELGMTVIAGLSDRNDKNIRIRLLEVTPKEIRFQGFDTDEVVPMRSITAAKVESYQDSKGNTRVRSVIFKGSERYYIHASIADPIAVVFLVRGLMERE